MVRVKVLRRGKRSTLNQLLGEAPPTPRMLLHYRQGIEDELRYALEGLRPSLSTMLRYHLGWNEAEGSSASALQGKGFRPSLCLFAADAVGGRWEAALPAAAALELIHNFSLIHDDIQDEDLERRHRSTVWALWGKAQGVVAGNTMRVLADRALLAMTQRGVAPTTVLEVAHIFTQRYQEMVHGQVLDLSFEQRLDVDVEEYLEMISRKSGALIDAAMELGALVGCGDAATARQLGRCGRLLGLTYQLRDDLLGVWGDSLLTGKAVGADLRRRKKAFPAVYALQHARGRAGQTLHQIYASREELDDAQIAQVQAIMEEVGAHDAAQRLAEEKCQQALELATQVELGAQARDELAELASFLLHRLS